MVAYLKNDISDLALDWLMMDDLYVRKSRKGHDSLLTTLSISHTGMKGK